MGVDESLGLPHRFESPGCRTTHPSLSHPGRLVTLLSPIIFILLSTVYRARNQLPMSDTIAAQLIRHDLSGLTTMATQQTLEEPLCSCTISFGLKVDINYLTILVHGPPQVMLLAVDFDEDLINVECVAIALMFPLQPASIFSSELYAPETV